MAWINSRELESLRERLEWFESEEKERKDKSEITRLRRLLDSQRETSAKELTKLEEKYERQIESLTDANSKQIRKINKDNSRKIDSLEDSIEDLKDSLEKNGNKRIKLQTQLDDFLIQQADIDDSLDRLTEREVELNAREAEVKARERAVGNFEDIITRTRKESEARLEDVRKEGYETGYADGIADGLRKVYELNKPDRDLLEKVVMVTLAKDQPNFKEELGEVVKDNLATILSPKKQEQKKK